MLGDKNIERYLIMDKHNHTHHEHNGHSHDITNISGGNPVNYQIQLLEDYTIELPLIGTINCKDKSFPSLQKEVINAIKSTFSVFYINL